MPLTEHHHLFLQAMLLRRAAPQDTWLNIWRRCAEILELQVVDNAFPAFYGEINARIEPLGFRIVHTIDGGIGPILANRNPQKRRNEAVDGSGGPAGGNGIYLRLQGKHWLALVNTCSDESAKIATDLNPGQLGYFRRLVRRIIMAPNRRYCLSTHEAIRVHSKIPNMKKSEAQTLLNTLVKQGWLSVTDGIYTLAIRAQLELESYLKDSFDEEYLPPTCIGCREMVMRGYQCPNEKCGKAVHVKCQDRIKRCICKTPWSPDNLIGEDAPHEQYVSSEEEEEEGGGGGEEEEASNNHSDTQTQTQTQKGKGKKRQSAASGPSSQKKTRPKNVQHSDDDDDELQDGPSQPHRRRSNAPRGSTRNA